ncbi:uncharacterized protein Dwil_GK22922 [Drosophila willistoni]|uniref:Uncharacterized protein n=1 Tax=Drosophila willistoni TaxID=7260 RepID=B4NNA9_DROWI|nr:uncharacterized protein Dwil_GK22922 [Drosophila willistoni]
MMSNKPIIVLKHMRTCYMQDFMKYSISERGRARENIHFLQIQREQLENLRRKKLHEKQQVTDKMNQVDDKIDKLVKVADPESKSTVHREKTNNKDEDVNK